MYCEKYKGKFSKLVDKTNHLKTNWNLLVSKNYKYLFNSFYLIYLLDSF